MFYAVCLILSIFETAKPDGLSVSSRRDASRGTVVARYPVQERLKPSVVHDVVTASATNTFRLQQSSSEPFQQPLGTKRHRR